MIVCSRVDMGDRSSTMEGVDATGAGAANRSAVADSDAATDRLDDPGDCRGYHRNQHHPHHKNDEIVRATTIAIAILTTLPQPGTTADENSSSSSSSNTNNEENGSHLGD